MAQPVNTSLTILEIVRQAPTWFLQTKKTSDTNSRRRKKLQGEITLELIEKTNIRNR